MLFDGRIDPQLRIVAAFAHSFHSVHRVILFILSVFVAGLLGVNTQILSTG